MTRWQYDTPDPRQRKGVRHGCGPCWDEPSGFLPPPAVLLIGELSADQQFNVERPLRRGSGPFIVDTNFLQTADQIRFTFQELPGAIVDMGASSLDSLLHRTTALPRE
ncbi:hypothetical protein K2224_15870 [Streptomyces sp. BHT-5-2]|uniref:hypothetical protein n=1 Tax=Streptomyces sp. BHT-5-2 TaxID=2866715 RepID=UPI001C8E10B7|nr:hypothetical protein [Streptomyces sp. BHT-5-2]QZL04466.1 hypothetical protein K2224_15870 [Streptomyces sp. BHT-5-2]